MANSVKQNGVDAALEEMLAPEVDIDAAIEAILFAAGRPLTYEELAKPFEMKASLMRERVKIYAERYNTSELSRGVILLAFENTCQLCTKEDFLQHIRIALGIRRSGSLSTSSLEALAIVAYNQPVTRAYVDAVRGVDSSYAMGTLVERGLIEAKGRLDAPGRPVLYGTSEGFLRCFGLSSLEELPKVTSEEAVAALSKLTKTPLGKDIDTLQISMDVEGEENRESEPT